MAAPPPSRYQILGRLASGGMGEILLARRIGPVGFEKLVVLKRPLGAASRGHVTALIDEARLLARINHPNVCQVHDLEEGDAGYFLVLEHLEGMSWWALIVEAERAGAPPELAAVCGMIEQACDGLDAIHDLARRDGAPAGIVHRDISPGNLFLTDTGVAKILDLGIAKTDDGEVTAPGAGPRGKLPYLSPEQVAGAPVDRRADVFGLGLVLHDLALGRRPSPQRVGALAAEALVLDGLPAPLASVIRTAVATDPAQRFATAGDLAAAIRGAASAVGGSLGRAALARWLSARFGPALAARRAEFRRLTSAAAEPATATQRFELRSLVHAAIDDVAVAPGARAVAPPLAPAATDAAPPLAPPPGVEVHATAELAPPAPLIQLRAHPAIAEAHARMARAEATPQNPGREPVVVGEAPARMARAEATPQNPGGQPVVVGEVPARMAHGPALSLRRRRGLPLALAIAVSALAAVAGIAAAAWWPVHPDPDPTPRVPEPAVATRGASAQPITPDHARFHDGATVAALPRASGERSAVVERATPPSATPPSAAAAAMQPGAGVEARAAAPPRVEHAHDADPVIPPEPVPASAPDPAPVRRAVERPTAPVRRVGGRLSIDSDPFAVIDLDGRPLGTTPLYQVQVTAGRHVLRAETGDGRVQRRAVEVAPGDVAAVVLRWPSAERTAP